MNKKNVTIGLIIAGFSFLMLSCQLENVIEHNFPNIEDYKEFDSRPLYKSNVCFKFYTSKDEKYPRIIKSSNNSEISFDQFLAENNTVAFLIIKSDTIQYERYFEGYSPERIAGSFSMAKSVTSILIGCAIDEGLIKSVEEPVTNYIPELKRNGFDKVKIRHLLQMTSGIKFNESYINPFGDAATFYYGRDLRSAIAKMELKNKPGLKFEYCGGNSQLLGLVLERSLKNRTITEYLQEKLWTPLGMEYPASWNIDKKDNGLEKTFCCLNACARDFAKIGRLYKNKGNWNGTQIVSQKWVEESVRVDTSEGGTQFYKYLWWLPTTKGDFMAKGMGGQFIYVNPSKDLIIVRLGRNEGRNVEWSELCTALAEGY